jgi:glutathionylspermidine synthase
MSTPAPPPDPRYDEFARELVASNILGDPWIYGRERFRLDPIVLTAERHAALATAAEEIAAAFDEGARHVWEHPEALDGYFGLTPYQKLMWLASSGRWHGIARLDLFVLPDGSIRCCEMNSDTPSGEAEAVLLNRLRHPHHPGLVDPNSAFPARFVGLVEEYHRASGREGSETASVAIIYPTDLPEDLSMIAIYREWLESRGHRVVLGAPANLPRVGDGIGLFDERVDVVVRHYKTDWWGERRPAWRDEPPYDDPDPLDPPLRILLDADARGAVAVVNPFGSVITQNKLMMAYLWDHREALSSAAARAIERYIPETRRLVDVDAEALAKDEWVLKSDYGCEGDEVIIGRSVSDPIWRESLEKVIASRWIVQRYFEAETDAALAIANYGVYLLGGRTAGIYTRISTSATDVTALSVPTFVRTESPTQT